MKTVSKGYAVLVYVQTICTHLIRCCLARIDPEREGQNLYKLPLENEFKVSGVKQQRKRQRCRYIKEECSTRICVCLDSPFHKTVNKTKSFTIHLSIQREREDGDDATAVEMEYNGEVNV